MEKRNIFNMEAGGMRDEALKKKVKMIKDIAIQSTILLMEDNKTHMFAAGIGLYQGLKYKGSFVNGIKGGVAAYGTMIVANTIQNIISNRDAIKDA